MVSLVTCTYVLVNVEHFKGYSSDFCQVRVCILTDWIIDMITILIYKL